MHWFRKARQPDVWEVPDSKPLGDIEAAQKIREICASAATIAEKTVGGRAPEKNKAAETERYQAAIKRALEIAMKISDDSMRDASVSQIIGLCVMVDHMKTARILVRAIKSENTRTELIAGNPALAVQETAR
jgi:primase-polymerase (primpol)-like protein